MTPKEFIAKLASDNEALFEAGELQVKAYFDSNPSQSELVEHFVGRMVNERMNMVEIAQAVASSAANMDPAELTLLTRQATDEAKHFQMVKEVIEHITGEELNVEAAIAAESAKPTAKGAALLDKYAAHNDELALALYQFIAEGRAERNWNMMANCIADEFISTRYAKIAVDEGFHSTIGELKLAELCTTPEAQSRAVVLAEQMRKDLFEVSCANSLPTEEAKAIVTEAYGW